MTEYRNSSHTVYDIKYHFVWITKYRYKILRGKIAFRARGILKQGCEANGFMILKGSVGADHVHMLLSCPTDVAPSKIMCGLCMKVTLKTILPLSGQGLHPSKKIISSRKLLPLL